jgi:hypothetical protein
MVIIGRVYKLHKENCEYSYIGSTHSPYMCIRMCHHRQAHRRKEKDYKGLFDGGDPQITILEEVELSDDKNDVSLLRATEEKWFQMTPNCINQRRCHVTPEEKKEKHGEAVKKYHNSALGKVALRKANLNQKLKKYNNLKVSDQTIDHVRSEIKFLEGLQKQMKSENPGVKPYASSYKVSS